MLLRRYHNREEKQSDHEVKKEQEVEKSKKRKAKKDQGED